MGPHLGGTGAPVDNFGGGGQWAANNFASPNLGYSPAPTNSFAAPNLSGIKMNNSFGPQDFSRPIDQWRSVR